MLTTIWVFSELGSFYWWRVLPNYQWLLTDLVRWWLLKVEVAVAFSYNKTTVKFDALIDPFFHKQFLYSMQFCC